MTPRNKYVDIHLKLIGIFQDSQVFKAGAYTGKLSRDIELMLVDEMIKKLEQIRKPEYALFISSYEPLIANDGYEEIDFWKEVKEIIIKSSL